MCPTWKTRIALAQALAVAALSAGCEQKSSSEAGPRVDAATDKYAAVDSKLAKALQSATSASASSDNGPPPEGVFAPGVADRRHPRGAPTKVDLSSPGAEPRTSLARVADTPADAARARGYGPALLEFGMQMGRAATPTIDFGLVLGPSKKSEETSDWLLADVRKATPAKEQYGQLPEGSDKDIASLNGTEIRIQLTPDGRVEDEQLELGKTTHPELDRIAQNAADALLLFTVPVPLAPLGVGAQWIAETRMPWVGVDVIAYRAFQVKSIEGDHVTLSLVIQAYAASKDPQLQGVPKGATLEQFEAQAQGECELVRGELLPRKAAMEQRMTLIFQAPTEGAPAGLGATGPKSQPQGGMMAAKFQGQASLLRGDDLRAASAR